MSNPLAIFRKHQKVLLAVFGVALMLVFTVGGIVSQYMGSPGSTGDNPVVVRIDSGSQLGLEDLNEGQMQNLRYSRILLQNFMRSVNYLASSRGGEPRQWLGVPVEDNEESLLRSLLLSRKASEMGIVVTDESIKRYLRSYSDGKVEDREFGELLRSVSQGRFSQPQFFDAMRNELLALRFLELFYRGIDPLPPAVSWDYFQRLNRQVSIEAAPFPVASYLSKVEEPADTEIAQLYEEGKDRYSMPNSPDPGFKERKKIALEYVKADLQTFLDEEKPKITDAEVAEYYEANKQEFRTLAGPSSGTTSSGSSGPALDDVDLPFDELEESTTPETERTESGDSTEDQAPASDAPSAEDAGTIEEAASADDAAMTDEPATADEPTPQPLQDDPTDEGPKVNEAPPEDLQSPEGEEPAIAGQEEPATEDEEPAVADQEEPATEDDAAAPEEPATVEEPTAEEPTATPEPETPETASTDTEADLRPEAEPAPTEETPATTEEMELGPLPEAAGGNLPEAAPEFRPLEEVTDEIRTRLARPRARERMDAAINAVRSSMGAYYRKYVGWSWSPEDDRQPQPTPPDLQALAAEHNLTAGKIPLVDILQLQESDPVTGEPRYEISRAYDTSFTPFPQLIFGGKDLPTYKESTIRGAVLDTEFLFWETDEVAERTPTLDECRAEVIRAIKMRKALDVAMEAARKEADRARSSGSSLGAAFRDDPNRKVIETSPFSWMTPANVPYLPPTVSRIPGIQYPGPDFMREVFRLKVGEIGVTTDRPQETVYIVSVKSENTDQEKLRAAFMRTGVANDVRQLSQLENRELLSQWYETFEKELGIKWEREPRPDSRLQ